MRSFFSDDCQVEADKNFSRWLAKLREEKHIILRETSLLCFVDDDKQQQHEDEEGMDENNSDESMFYSADGQEMTTVNIANCKKNTHEVDECCISDHHHHHQQQQQHALSNPIPNPRGSFREYSSHHYSDLSLSSSTTTECETKEDKLESFERSTRRLGSGIHRQSIGNAAA
mmetsp:Transcript_9633/g.14105  ORF Transcript_9633/g.14105 Transcript_9633/m.14105 type:complete len:172 (-) Transcript_9633:71-586(-)